MGGGALSGRRGGVFPLGLCVFRGVRTDLAAHRARRLTHQPLPRASAARAVTIRLDDLHVPGVSRSVARLGDRDQLFGAALHDAVVDPDPEGKGRAAPLVGVDRRVYRRPRRDASRSRHADDGRLFRACQCGPDLQRRRRDPPHERHRIDRDADRLPDDCHHALHDVPAAVRVHAAGLAGFRRARLCPHRQRHRAVLVDALPVAGAAVGGRAVQLSVADLGGDARLCDLGRRADREPARRLRDRRCLRPIHPMARDLAAAAPGGAGPAGRRGQAVRPA